MNKKTKKIYKILIVIVLIAMLLSIIAPLIAISQPTDIPVDTVSSVESAPTPITIPAPETK